MFLFSLVTPYSVFAVKFIVSVQLQAYVKILNRGTRYLFKGKYCYTIKILKNSKINFPERSPWPSVSVCLYF